MSLDSGFKMPEPSIKRRRVEADEDATQFDAEVVTDDAEQFVSLDEGVVRRMVGRFEKALAKNQQLRLKFPDQPEKFMDSEVELDDEMRRLQILATAPEFYPLFVKLGTVGTLTNLLIHENPDVAIEVVTLFKELTDADATAEYDQETRGLVDAMIAAQTIEALVQNLDRLDEAQSEDKDAVFHTMTIIENLCELDPKIGDVVYERSRFLPWLLKRLQRPEFDYNKQYASELLAVLLQNSEHLREQMGSTLDGLEAILQSLSPYRKVDPSSPEELELMENLFDCLCSCLMLTSNKPRFLDAEGVELMLIVVREKMQARRSALKALDYACLGVEGAGICERLIERLGLKSVFAAYMKKGTKSSKKLKGYDGNEEEAHVISIISSLFKNVGPGVNRDRLLAKYSENEFEKVDRLVELHFQYVDRVRLCEDQIDQDRQEMERNGQEIDDEKREEFYVLRLDAGLFTLQLIDYIMACLLRDGDANVHSRVRQQLKLRGGDVSLVKTVLQEYANNVSDGSRDADDLQDLIRLLSQ